MGQQVSQRIEKITSPINLKRLRRCQRLSSQLLDEGAQKVCEIVTETRHQAKPGPSVSERGGEVPLCVVELGSETQPHPGDAQSR